MLFKIDRGYLNAIVKGRKPGSENIRAKIATYFNMAYEDMLILGRQILEGRGELTSEENSSRVPAKEGNAQLTGKGKEIIAFKNHQKNQKLPSGISNNILKVIEILDSGTSDGDLLAGLINAFHEAISTKEENLSLRNRMKKLESRITSLEKRLGDEKEYVRKSA